MLIACAQAFAFTVGDRRVIYIAALQWESRVETYSPLRALAGGAEVSISQPVNSKTKHIICFQSFAEQITITTTILGDNKRTEKHHFYWLGSRGPGGNGPFHEGLFWCLLSWRICKGLWLKKQCG